MVNICTPGRKQTRIRQILIMATFFVLFLDMIFCTINFDKKKYKLKNNEYSSKNITKKSHRNEISDKWQSRCAKLNWSISEGW